MTPAALAQRRAAAARPRPKHYRAWHLRLAALQKAIQAPASEPEPVPAPAALPDPVNPFLTPPKVNWFDGY